MFMTKNAVHHPLTVLSILKSLPLEDRVYMIERPHVRRIVELHISDHLAEGTLKKNLTKNVRNVVDTFRKKEMST
jgi:hypothetical protein